MFISSLDGLSYSKIRSRAREHATLTTPDAAATAADVLLHHASAKRRQFAVYLLGFTSAARPANLDLLRLRVAADTSWVVQEALAQALDAYCAAITCEAALPTIDSWLRDSHPNVRRAVSEGLRPWTAKSRPYFARHPEEAIHRLSALRADPSEYVRHSAGNALRDIRRVYPALIDAETATWNLADPRESFTYKRVLQAQ
ncbi:MAG TPA: DNA alkylation repair protein [Ktedonobacterales bacterium]